jgi:hypothetical protein
MGFTKLGQIDSSLRFTPEPPSNAYDSAEEYRPVAGHRHIVTYGADGKTKTQKEITESVIWQIDGSPGSPWTKVNTADRYVLEQKAKATDPLVLKNADQTLTKLLALIKWAVQRDFCRGACGRFAPYLTDRSNFT